MYCADRILCRQDRRSETKHELWYYNIAESFDFNRFSSMSAAFRCTRSTMNDEGKTNRELRGSADHYLEQKKTQTGLKKPLRMCISYKKP